MEKRQSPDCPSHRSPRTPSSIRTLAIISILVTLPACTTLKTGEGIRFKSETELGVSAIRIEWLKNCEGLAGPPPTNEVGNLLQDYADLAAAFRICLDRHNSLTDYLSPIVKKEQTGKP